MADNALLARSPLQNWVARFAALGADVVLEEEPFVTMVSLWTDSPATPAVSSLLGVDALPTVPNTVTRGDTASAIWMGPGEWLVTSAHRSGPDLESALIEALADGAAADVSAQRTTLRLRGPHTLDILAKGCSLDLHPSVFGVGSVAQTMLARAGVLLVPADPAGTDYRILVRSTFADYLAEWLLDAAAEFTTTTEFSAP